ncbi:MAG: isochorismatase family cysteine hydrolase [Bacillota bacterium]|nr:isochorismatase family cysteine hydrolase [Bacillota bacterium]
MKALLVIDMIYDFIDPGGALYIGPVADILVPAVKERIDIYRSENKLVIYICDRHLNDDREFEMFPPHSLKGSGGDEIVSELLPLDNEQIIHKRRYSAFFGTDLDLTLRDHGVSDVELVGCVTNICILYTAALARMLSYRVTVPVEAVASFDHDAHNFALREMEKTLGVTLI